MKKYLFIAFLICNFPTILLSQSSGQIHNKMMGKLISGQITSSNSIKEYIDKMYISETGSPSNITNDFCNKVKSNLVLEDPLLSISKLNTASVINTEISNFLKSFYNYFSKYANSDTEIPISEYNITVDSLSNAIVLSSTARSTANELISILKSSYEFQLNSGNTNLGVNNLNDNFKNLALLKGPNVSYIVNNNYACRGFWRKFCIVIWDVIGGAFGAAICQIAPPSCPFTIPFFAALFSYASSCCGVCCPATYGCINSNLCCICFGKYCQT